VLAAVVVSGEPRVAVTRSSTEEIDELWAGRETEHEARLDLLDEPERLLEAEQRTFDVRVENLGSVVWPWGERGEPEVRLSYQWLDSDGNVLEYGLRTPFPADLGPGGSQVVPLHVLAPSRAGRYRLRFDLVHEHVSWFGCGVEREVEVERRLRVALLGDETAVERTLVQLAEEAPEFEPVVLSAEPNPPRFGPPRAPDLRAYLLHETVPGRRRDWWSILVRSLALTRATRRRRAGLEARPLLHGGQEFLDVLGGCTHLLRLWAPPHSGLRERWLERITLRTARRLGVTVVVPEPGKPGLR
jgi:hypothetical protein